MDAKSSSSGFLSGGGPVDGNPVARAVLLGTALLFLGAFVGLPVVSVVASAVAGGAKAMFASWTEEDALSALKLTLLATAISVPLNTVFGVAAAWLVARFRFRGRALILSFIELPLTVSPVVAGMMIVFLFGESGLFGRFLIDHDLRILYAPPAIVAATVFVTFPFVARELVPVLSAEGIDEEEAALVLGAGPWTTFRRVTLPKIRYGLLHGLVLATARAIGEFGAVSVVSGHIRGETNTVPLHIEQLYGEAKFTDAFSVATLLLFTAVLSLVLRRVIARVSNRTRTETEAAGETA